METDAGNAGKISKSRGKEYTRRKLHTIHIKARRALKAAGIKEELKRFKQRTGLTDEDILDRVSVTASHIAESSSKVQTVHDLMKRARGVGEIINMVGKAISNAKKIYDVVGPIIALALAL
jgi:hypothetical protein